MKKIIGSIALSAVLAASAMSFAAITANGADIELKPMQAHTVALTDHTAVVYYVMKDNGEYEVVATVAPNTGVDGNATQHRVTLYPGQTWSLDLDNGDSSRVISVSVASDSLLVATR